MKRLLFAAAAALALLCPRPALAQYDVAGSLTSTTCAGTGGGAQAQETGCLVMNLSAQTGSVSVQVSGNADTLQFEVTDDSSNWVSCNAYPQPSGVAVTSTAGNGIWQADTAGAKRFRVRASAGAAATITMSQSLDPAVGSGGTQAVAGTGTAGSPNAGVVTVQGITAGTPVQAQGILTNNNAAPGATNIGTIPCLANSAAPSWTEGNAVFCSVDLVGRQRVIGTTANDTNAIQNGIETLPGVARAAPTAITAGRSEKLEQSATNGGVFTVLADGVSTGVASVPANDATAIANGLEVQPGVARATPTAITAGRSEKLQQSATNGGLFSALVGGAATTVVDAFANDTTAIGNGLQVAPGVARAGPTATTAGRSELLELDTVTGGQYVVEAATTSATGLTTTGIVTVTASQSIKGSAGNLYGFGVVNGAGAGCWLQCVNSATAGTLGTAVIFQAPLPTSATAYSAPGPIPLGTFSTGIACGVASAVNGASACGTAATGVAIYYK